MAAGIIIAIGIGCAAATVGLAYFLREDRIARGLETGLDDYLPEGLAPGQDRGGGGGKGAERQGIRTTDHGSHFHDAESV